jgi:putative addiction module antidote
MQNVKIRRVGNELAVILPEEWIAEAKLGEGDELVASVSDGALNLAPADGRHEWIMRLAREGMDEYREALVELAK